MDETELGHVFISFRRLTLVITYLNSWHSTPLDSERSSEIVCEFEFSKATLNNCIRISQVDRAFAMSPPQILPSVYF